MYHLNKAITETSYFWALVNKIFMPASYLAHNITDFLRNKGQVRPTEGFPRLLWGKIAIVEFGESLLFTPKWPNGSISDLSLSLDVIVDSNLPQSELDLEKLEILRTTSRLYRAEIMYNPKQDKSWLISFNTDQPGIRQRKRKEETKPSFGLCY